MADGQAVSASTLLLVLAIALGLYYGYLGISAGAHFMDESRRRSFSERVLFGQGWSVGPGDEYTEEGKNICRRGNLVLVATILCWLAWGFVK
jgi:hypothetical protein